MLITVAGGNAGTMMTVYDGGGDHGGPSCAKINLPKDWAALVARYHQHKPDYIAY